MNFEYLTGLGKHPRMPIVIEPDAIRQADEIIRRLELTGKGVALYDDDSYNAIADKPNVFRNLLYDSEQLYCDAQSVDFLHYTEQHIEECSFVVAVGGEAIQGIAKVICLQMHMPLIAVPTGAYGIDIASRYTDYSGPCGLERVEGTTPVAVIADTRLMAQAAESITLGGVRELIDRYALLARGKAIALAAGYEWNQKIAELQQQAILAALAEVNVGLRLGKASAYERLCEALIACGLAENACPLCSDYPARLNFLQEKALKEVPDCE